MDTKKKTRLAALVMAALSVVGIGGAAVAQTNGSPPATTQAQPETPAPADQDTLQEDNAADDATEAPEAEEAAEAPEADDANGPDEQSPSYSASITVPNNQADDSSDGPDDEAAEAEALAGLATITADEAKAAALAAVPGEVVQVELDNENGAVVYSVEVDTGSGIVDVKVDAGNANVVHQDADNDTEG